MNPQTGEILALVSLPTYDNNVFARGISNADYAKLLNDPRQAADQPRDAGAFPARLDLQARRGYRRAGGQEDHPDDKGPDTKAFSRSASTKFYDWNHRGFGPCDIYCGFGHSSDTFFFQMAGKLGVDRLAYWAKQYGFGAPTGIDLPGEVPGIVPSNAVEAGRARRRRSSPARPIRRESVRAMTS